MGGDACALIVGYFHLHCIADVVHKDRSGGGGPHVREGSKAAAVIQARLDAIYRQQQRDEDDEIEVEPKRLITLTIGWKGNITEYKYIVSKNRADRTVKVINLLNKYMTTINMTVSGWKRKLIEIKAKFTKR